MRKMGKKKPAKKVKQKPDVTASEILKKLRSLAVKMHENAKQFSDLTDALRRTRN
jgi:cell division septum initiation protein DivIVA